MDLPVYIGSVPTEELDKLDQKLKSSLGKIVSEGLDMTRMAMVINRDQRQVRYILQYLLIVSLMCASSGTGLMDPKVVSFLMPSSRTLFWARRMDRICFLQ